MENKNNSKRKRLLTYQVLQLQKEQKLRAREASLKIELENSENKLKELNLLLPELISEKEAAIKSLEQLKNSESEAIKKVKSNLEAVRLELKSATESLSQHEQDLKKIIDAKLKEAQDSPRALEIKSRLAYLNAEIKENNFKIEEYKKEAKKEVTLKETIEKLKAQEENLCALIAEGKQTLKRNYHEELDVATKEREGFEKQLNDFLTDENSEIQRLSDIASEMGIEASELNAELAVLRQSQSDAAAAMSEVESLPEVVALRNNIQTQNDAIAKHNQDIADLEAEIVSLKASELEAAKAQGKEQEYAELGNQIKTTEANIATLETKITQTTKEIHDLEVSVEKTKSSLVEATAGVVECENYNEWVANNKKFSDQMFPKSLELAIADCKKDRELATEQAREALIEEAERIDDNSRENCRQRAEEMLSERKIQPKGGLREKILESMTTKLYEYRIEKYISDKIESGTSEIWNKYFRTIRNERMAELAKAVENAKRSYNSSKSEESKAALEEAETARKAFDQSENDDTLLVVKNVRKYFPVMRNFFGKPTRYLKAVDDVSFRVRRGKTLGIVGESGCGKTTMGRTILRLHEITDGEIIFDGHHIESIKNREMRPLRTDLQIIFQDPYSSLSPRLPVGEIIGEAVKAHKIVPLSEYKEYITGVMKSCGLQAHYFSRFPHEFSGGQRQRICIARALAVNPKVVICDEPVSALDVSIQAQIINLLKDLQAKRNLTYIFISHDLSVVEHISDDVGVMYLGSMVESGPKERIFDNPMHPYTEALLSAVPIPDPNVKMNRIFLKGDIPSPSNPPRGCKFHTRCQKCMDVCRTTPPVYREYEKDHFVACHLYPQK